MKRWRNDDEKNVSSSFLSVAALGLGACGPQSEGTDSTAANSGSGKDYDLLVWEDQAKSAGIEEAVKQFEEEHDVTIKVVEKPMVDRSKIYDWMAPLVQVRMSSRFLAIKSVQPLPKVC